MKVRTTENRYKNINKKKKIGKAYLAELETVSGFMKNLIKSALVCRRIREKGEGMIKKELICATSL